MTNEPEWVEIVEDGVVHLYDPETGEYVGPKSKWLNPEIQGEADALAVMRALADCKAKQLGVKAKYDLLIKQQERELKRLTSREQWIMTTYENQLGRYAEANLPRKADGSYRVKTLTMPWGTIAVRETMAKVVPVNTELAVAWVKENAPEALKVSESVLVSKLPDEMVQVWKETGHTPIAFTIEPSTTKYVVKTVEE